MHRGGTVPKRYTVDGVTGSLRELSERYGVPYQTAMARFRRNGRNIEKVFEKERVAARVVEVPDRMIPADKLNLEGCWRLAAAVLGAAYEDTANLEALRMIQKDPNYSKAVIHKKETIIAQARRSAYCDLKYREFTEDELDEWTKRRIVEKIKLIENLGEQAEWFLQSDHAEVFCHSVDPDFVLASARSNVKKWADGKLGSYHLKGTS